MGLGDVLFLARAFGATFRADLALGEVRFPALAFGVAFLLAAGFLLFADVFAIFVSPIQIEIFNYFPLFPMEIPCIKSRKLWFNRQFN